MRVIRLLVIPAIILAGLGAVALVAYLFIYVFDEYAVSAFFATVVAVVILVLSYGQTGGGKRWPWEEPK